MDGGMLEGGAAIAPQSGQAHGQARDSARGWLALFCLSSIWVYAFQSGQTFLLIQSELHTQFMAVGIFQYPVQILGACAVPALLDRLGFMATERGDRLVFCGLMAAALLLMGAMWFASGFALPLTLLYLLTLTMSTAMGIAFRRGAMVWNPNRVALYVGGAHVLHYVASYIEYYSFFLTGSPLIYLACAYALFTGLPIAALAVRRRMARDAQAPSPAPALVAQPYPRAFLRAVLLVMALHALFSVLINTVWYFENDGEFPSLAYEIGFKLLALVVMGTGTWLLHKRRWFATTLICLLVLCLVQGLTLFGIESMPLAVSYNIATMAAKMPPYLLSLTVTVWYATARRQPGLACLGFGIDTLMAFLVLLTQLRPGTLGVIPRQGALLLVGLVLMGLLVWLYLRFQKIQTDEMLKSIRASQEERKTPEQTLDALNLTPREHEVAQMLLQGDSQKIIAAKLHISGATVGFHTKNLYRKLNIQSRVELFALLLAPPPPGSAERLGM